MSFAPSIVVQLNALLASRALVEAHVAQGKEQLANINQAITLLTTDAVAKAFIGKEGGTVRLAIGDKIFKAEIDKTVKWDSPALETIASTMPWNEARALFKITFEVPEKNFKDAGDNMRALLISARTVKYGQPKISPEK